MTRSKASGGREIVERDAHSCVVPGSATAAEPDATVAWSYIHLRFYAPDARQLRVRVTEAELLVSLHGHSPRLSTTGAALPMLAEPIRDGQACNPCGRTDYFRHADRLYRAPGARAS